jgi:epoxyqueuosine reductase
MKPKGKNVLERTGQIRRFARKIGADLFGVADAGILADAPEGFRPQDILPDCRAVVVIGKSLSAATVETTPSRMFDTMYFAVNGFLDRMLVQIVDFLASAGFKGVAVGPHSLDGKLLMGDLSQKHAAVAAGLGKFGLQSLVLTPRFGPRQRWGAVVTDARLKPGKPLREDLCHPSKCGYACIENCPAKVFSERNTVGITDRNFLPGGLWYYWNINKSGCRDYRAQKKKELGWVTEGGHACAVCLKVCPIGKQCQ